MLKEGVLWYRKGRGLLWWKGMYVMMEGERRMGIFFGQQKQAQGTFPKLMFEKARYKTNRRLYKVHTDGVYTTHTCSCHIRTHVPYIRTCCKIPQSVYGAQSMYYESNVHVLHYLWFWRWGQMLWRTTLRSASIFSFSELPNTPSMKWDTVCRRRGGGERRRVKRQEGEYGEPFLIKGHRASSLLRTPFLPSRTNTDVI